MSASGGPGERPPERPRPVFGRPRYGWLVGIVGLLLVAYISLNTLRTDGASSVGPAVGRQLPPFAAPLVGSDLEGDANVATRAGQDQAGSVPACSVDDPRALNICTLARSGPVVLAFLTSGSKTCTRDLDAMQQLVATFPRVRFAAVGIKGRREDFRRLAHEHRWTFPLAQDRDGAVSNLYGVAVCPTIVFARRGGEVKESILGSTASTRRSLEQRVRALERGGG